MPFTACKHTKGTYTQTEKSTYYHFMRFGDSITVRTTQPLEAVNSIHYSLPRYYLKYQLQNSKVSKSISISMKRKKKNMLTRDSMQLLLRTNYYHHATKLKSGKGKPALLNTEDCMPWLKFKGLESNNQVSLNTMCSILLQSPE